MTPTYPNDLTEILTIISAALLTVAAFIAGHQLLYMFKHRNGKRGRR